MTSFTFNIPYTPSLAGLKDILEQWIAYIEMNKDKYEVSIIQDKYQEPIYGKLAIRYNRKVLFFIVFYRKYKTLNNGKIQIFSMGNTRILNEGNELLNDEDGITMFVNDKFGTNYGKNQNQHLFDALMNVLPLRDQEKVERIVEILNIEKDDVAFDSYEKRYVIKSPINHLNWKQEHEPDIFYKYMSLKVFHLMMENKTFRMNSIVSQSDTTETFYLGDFLCDDYEDERKRFNGILSEKKVLISSFTTLSDDTRMWCEYGDEGKGVCLGFSLIGKGTLHQVQYIDENNTPLDTYRRRAKQLKEEGIRIHYSEIDNNHRFVKNAMYENEKEWRLIVEYEGELSNTVYNDDRYVVYHDFPFQGNKLLGIGIELRSICVGPCQPKGTTNFPLVSERAIKEFGNMVIINRSKLSTMCIDGK